MMSLIMLRLTFKNSVKSCIENDFLFLVIFYEF